MELPFPLELFGPIAFVVVATAVGLWIHALRRVEVPEDRGPYVAAWAVGATLGVLALTLGDGGALLRVPAWIAAILGSVLLLTVAISRQVVGTDAIAVGDTIPTFSALDERGAPFDSGTLSGHLLLIKFFRAHW
jgi:hypothetical protein